jgi:hypothetical protein
VPVEEGADGQPDEDGGKPLDGLESPDDQGGGVEAVHGNQRQGQGADHAAQRVDTLPGDEGPKRPPRPAHPTPRLDRPDWAGRADRMPACCCRQARMASSALAAGRVGRGPVGWPRRSRTTHSGTPPTRS